jgi:hypothetical protein
MNWLDGERRYQLRIVDMIQKRRTVILEHLLELRLRHISCIANFIGVQICRDVECAEEDIVNCTQSALVALIRRLSSLSCSPQTPSDGAR